MFRGNREDRSGYTSDFPSLLLLTGSDLNPSLHWRHKTGSFNTIITTRYLIVSIPESRKVKQTDFPQKCRYSLNLGIDRQPEDKSRDTGENQHPGDPAIQHPGDPAIQHPGDPAIQHPGDPAIQHPGDPAIQHPASEIMFHSGVIEKDRVRKSC
ncbi:hypothetical protein Pmani_010985 [Petrolisthes manimaculis]|uniref:Uncharacterized protein n=1 Tax=Petrolisthes manimaculis TaxID=1843537 RepID=A0AAE1UBH2_9EUCA|nr:hypothetical protein Pmani_010985 [Petrolisthes manimaculis]